ncbi:hypothetical protein [Streptomyces hydrogenans]
MTRLDGTARPLTPPVPSPAEETPVTEMTASSSDVASPEETPAKEHPLPRWLMIASTAVGLVCGGAAAVLGLAGEGEAAIAAAVFGAAALGGPRVTINIRK